MTKKYYDFVKSIMFSLSVTDIIFGHLSMISVWNCSQNCCTQAHLQKRQMIASHSFLQNEQLLSFSMPICFKTTLVPNILCTNLIWNHFSFVSWIFCCCCIFLKEVDQLICLFSLASHFSQQSDLFVCTEQLPSTVSQVLR